jgi:hypothetical protein
MKKTRMKSGQTTVTKTIIGIDYSLTSPAICVNNGNLMFYYLTSKKKWTGVISEEIVGYEHKEWTDPIQRFTFISDFALDIISTTNNPTIYIEGYSFGSKGQGVFQIAENCGILKYSLLEDRVWLPTPLYHLWLRKVQQAKVMQIKI